MKTLEKLQEAIAKGKCVIIHKVNPVTPVKSIKVWNGILTIETSNVKRYRHAEETLEYLLSDWSIYPKFW